MMIIGRFQIVLGLMLLFCCQPAKNKKPEQNFEGKFQNLTCMFFFITDCPASRDAFTDIKSLNTRFERNGLKFDCVLSDPDPQDSAIRAVLKYYEFSFPVQVDSLLEMSMKYGASTTPQVILIDSLGHVKYSGAINNRYYKYGKHSEKVSESYLSDAIESILLGNEVIIPTTKPVGCRINYNFRN